MAKLTSKFQRIFSIQSDAYGVDPIRDRLVPMINKIQTYSLHPVTQDERAAPDLISLREYQTDEFWWIILAFNGISSYRSLVEGVNLRIPSMSEIVTIVTENSIRPNRVQRVITI